VSFAWSPKKKLQSVKVLGATPVPHRKYFERQNMELLKGVFRHFTWNDKRRIGQHPSQATI
jgi:hypothetical protein